MDKSEQTLRRLIREEIKTQLKQEYENHALGAADYALRIRAELNQLNTTKMIELVNMIREFDSDKAGWAESILEELRDVEEELYSLGNELSMR